MDNCPRDQLKTRLNCNQHQRMRDQHLAPAHAAGFDEHRLFNQTKFKLFMAEFLGTFILVYLSKATLTSFELTGTQNDTINRQTATILGHGLAFLMATFLTLSLSGAHLNPAYTLASASFGYLKWSRALNYLLAQYLGAFVAAIFLHATYSDKLAQRHTEGLLTGANVTLKAHGNILSTGKFFSSFPPTEVSLTQLSVSYTLASAYLMLLLLAVHDCKLLRIPRSVRPIYLASALVLVEAAFAANGGPVLNPAQDFSPRLYIAMFGWSSAAFNLYHYKYWWFCGLLVPHLGALVGFGLYQVFAHLANIQPRTPNQRNSQEQDYRLARDNEF